MTAFEVIESKKVEDWFATIRLMLESQSPRSQGVVMNKKKSYENFTLKMLFLHSGEVCQQE